MTQTLVKLTQSKPFIICEVGSNFLTPEDCFNSVSEAKRCGAHAVKFQMFDWQSLYGYWPTKKYKDRTWYGSEFTVEESLEPLHGGLPRDWVEPIYEKCLALDIEFMCTAFSPGDAEFLNPYVNYHKVASSDLEYRELFETLLTFRKPILFSTGGHTDDHVERVLSLLSGHPAFPLYCVASYPAKTIQLENIKRLSDKFKVAVGFSDHSIDILETPKNAAKQGAIIIEKHFKLRDMDTPDNPHSLNPKEFKLMIDNIQDRVQTKLLTHEEQDMVLKYNRRLIATEDIGFGQVFVYGKNYGAYRSLTPNDGGISAWLGMEISGKACKKDLKKGDHITIDSLLL